MRLNLERFCTVWMAGIAAEIIIVYGVAPRAAKTAKTQEVNCSLGRPEARVTAQRAPPGQRAETMIKEHWAACEEHWLLLWKNARC
jgi:hypothetical protein